MAACDSGNPVLNAIVGFFDFLGDPIGTILHEVALAVLSAAITVFGTFTDAINTLPGLGAVQSISDQVQWLVVYIAVGSLLFAAIRMALERRGEAGATAAKGVARMVVVAGAATAIATAASNLADRFSAHLFSQSAGAVASLSNIECSTDTDGIPNFLLLVLALLLLIAALVNMIVLLVRLGAVTLLLGTLPIAAAASMTDWGNGWWRKHIGWLVAWLLYKPATALIIFAGSTLLSGNGDAGGGIQDRIAGIAVMLLSAISLPALLKLVVPATAALGGGNAAGQVISSAGGGLASGARSLASAGVSGGGSVGGAGPSGASGGAGPAGRSGASGDTGDAGRSGGSGPAGGAGHGGGSGAAGALARAGGPAGVAIGVATGAARAASGAATSAIGGSDGDLGHNR